MNECRLDLAAHRGILTIVKLAIKAGVVVNAPAYRGKRPIEFAREAGQHGNSATIKTRWSHRLEHRTSNCAD